MPKHRNNYGMPSEQEVALYFYGYQNNVITGDEDVFSSLPDVITVYTGVINNYNSPISILKKLDDDLTDYSVGGLNTLDVYTTQEEKSQYKQALRDVRKVLAK